MNYLVIGDLHLRATGEEFPVDQLPIESHDAVISLGDIIDDNRDHAKSVEAGEAYEQRGRELFKYLDRQNIPVLAVPGNHDPVECTERLTSGFESVSVLHKNTVTFSSGDMSCSIVGWGCEQFDFTSALLSPSYPELPLSSDTFPTGDNIADTLLRKAGRYLAGIDTLDDLIDGLGIEDGETDAAFMKSLSTLEERFEELVEIIEAACEPVIVASHISPFHVPFDQGGIDTRDGEYHFGSLALRLALAETSPAGCLSGHTHQQGLTIIDTGAGHTYAYNPGAPGVASVTVDDEVALQPDPLKI